MTIEYIVAVTQKLTKTSSMAFVLENVAVCNLTCKCVHSGSLTGTEASLIVCNNQMKSQGSVFNPSMNSSPVGWLCSS